MSEVERWVSLVLVGLMVIGMVIFLVAYIAAEVRLARWVKEPDPDPWVRRTGY